MWRMTKMKISIFFHFDLNINHPHFHRCSTMAKKMETWQNFNDLSSRDQQSLMKSKVRKQRRKKRDHRCAEARFKLVEKDIRHEIKKNSEPWAAVAGLEWLVRRNMKCTRSDEEQEMSNSLPFPNTADDDGVEAMLKHTCTTLRNEEGELVLTFSNLDSYERRMLHAVCKYYNLRTKGSHCREDSFVALPSSSTFVLPIEPLSTHLKKVYGQRSEITEP
eukprot:m.115076 g.115076  ORF g.115076 m.115076 type:complete len:219 (+) comp9287_c0_seq2:746-1402(+)